MGRLELSHNAVLWNKEEHGPDAQEARVFRAMSTVGVGQRKATRPSPNTCR